MILIYLLTIGQYYDITRATITKNKGAKMAIYLLATGSNPKLTRIPQGDIYHQHIAEEGQENEYSLYGEEESLAFSCLEAVGAWVEATEFPEAYRARLEDLVFAMMMSLALGVSTDRRIMVNGPLQEVSARQVIRARCKRFKELIARGENVLRAMRLSLGKTGGGPLRFPR